MKLPLCIAWLLLSAAGPSPALAQVYRTKDDYAFLSSKHVFHFVGDDKPLQASDLEGLPARPMQPVQSAGSHPIEVAESERAYGDGRFTDAVNSVAQAAALIPPDPTVLNCYARALYRQENARDQSYPAYQRLVALLDRYGQEGRETVSVYIPFLEAYFKLATLQLDKAEWAAASYNLSRTAAALQSTPEAASENLLLREQILQYQTECFAHMHENQLCRYFGERTLKYYPANRYVLQYLAALPKPVRKPSAQPRR